MTSPSAKKLLESGWTFAQIPAAAMLDPELSDGAFRQMVYMAWRRNQDGDTYPSLETIAEDMGKGTDTAARRNGELEEQHYIAVVRGRGRSNHYTIYAKATVPEKETSRKNAATLDEKYPQKCGQSTRKNAALTIVDSLNISLAANAAEDATPDEFAVPIITAGVPSDETMPEQKAAGNGNGSSRSEQGDLANAKSVRVPRKLAARVVKTPVVGKNSSDGDEVRQKDAIPYNHKAVFSALVEVCHVDAGGMRGILNQTVKRLSQMETPPSPGEIRELYGRSGPWYSTDFRKEGRPVPSLALVVSEICKMREALSAQCAAVEAGPQTYGAGRW